MYGTAGTRTRVVPVGRLLYGDAVHAPDYTGTGQLTHPSQ